MKLGKAIFKSHFINVEILLQESAKQENPANWLFLNDLRTPMFMLESILRVYDKNYDSKKIEKLKDQFKFIEDQLGLIDYYSNYVTQFGKSENKDKKELVVYFKDEADKQIKVLNKYLKNEGWLNQKKINKINELLEKIKWMEQKEEIRAIKKFYIKNITKVEGYIRSTNYEFDDLEDNIHELRREIRWLSIYPRAMQGIFQFETETIESTGILKKYHTKEILDSPFNIMPKEIIPEITILLNKNYFLALSWTINELGKLKDEGLQILAIKEALKKIDTTNKKLLALSENNANIRKILTKAENITQVFIEDKILQNLVLIS